MSGQRLQDTLHLWCLADPQAPVPVGEIRLVMRHRGSSRGRVCPRTPSMDWHATSIALSCWSGAAR